MGGGFVFSFFFDFWVSGVFGLFTQMLRNYRCASLRRDGKLIGEAMLLGLGYWSAY